MHKEKGIKDKLPLIRSESRIIRLFGYVVYTFVILFIIGILIPSPPPTPEAPPTPAITTPTTLEQTPSTSIEEAKEYLISSLEKDPVIVDAAVTLEGRTASIAVMVACPPEDSEEVDRVYTLSSTMAKVFLTEHGVKNALIGVYKGKTQLKLDTEEL